MAKKNSKIYLEKMLILDVSLAVKVNVCSRDVSLSIFMSVSGRESLQKSFIMTAIRTEQKLEEYYTFYFTMVMIYDDVRAHGMFTRLSRLLRFDQKCYPLRQHNEDDI